MTTYPHPNPSSSALGEGLSVTSGQGVESGESLSLSEARALAAIASRLDRRPRPTRDPAVQKVRLLETIRALGCVQLDTISVVSRSHETVL
jgi:uncharacterized protein YcaQ